MIMGFKLLTPISHLFSNAENVQKIVAASDFLEARERTADLRLDNTTHYHIDFDLNLGEATMLPRLHKDWPYNSLRLEKGFSRDTLQILESFGHELEESKTMGSTQSILISKKGKEGFADLRRPNAGVAIQID